MQTMSITVRAFIRSRVAMMANQDGVTIDHSDHFRLYLCSVPDPRRSSSITIQDGTIHYDKCNHAFYIHTTRLV